MTTKEIKSLKKESLKLHEKANRYAKKIRSTMTIAEMKNLEKLENESDKAFSLYQKQLLIAKG